MAIDIFCADIGAVSRNNFGWFGHLATGQQISGTDMAALSAAVRNSIESENQVALGFEAPMFAPFRDTPSDLTKKRNGETNPNWIGGPGATVMATALVQVPWILRAIRGSSPWQATMSWSEFKTMGIQLFLWEAFVSGAAKGASHVDDARIAVSKFQNSLPDPSSHNAINEPSVISLLGTAMLITGWCNSISMLTEACVVIKA